MIFLLPVPILYCVVEVVHCLQNCKTTLSITPLNLRIDVTSPFIGQQLYIVYINFSNITNFSQQKKIKNLRTKVFNLTLNIDKMPTNLFRKQTLTTCQQIYQWIKNDKKLDFRQMASFEKITIALHSGQRTIFIITSGVQQLLLSLRISNFHVLI